MSVHFSPTGSLFVSTDREGGIILWSSESFTPLDVSLGGHSQAIRSAVFSPDGRLLATGSDDRTVIIWDTTNWEAQHMLVGHEARIEKVVFSEDSKKLLSAGDDNLILLWDVSTGQRIGSEERPLRAHQDWVFGLAYHPQGTSFASAGRDGDLYVWQATANQWEAAACGRANRNLNSEEWDRFFGGRLYLNTCQP